MKDKKWWHIRKYFKSNHHALIVDEDNCHANGKYYYMDITTHPAKKAKYIKLSAPINNKDECSYVRKYVGKAFKKKFSRWISKYEINSDDMNKIENYLKNKNNKK